MTVSELIEKLHKYPPDAYVVWKVHRDDGSAYYLDVKREDLTLLNTYPQDGRYQVSGTKSKNKQLVLSVNGKGWE